ncbi:MAG TPA: molybdopterin-binding protein, partial [Bacteroidota bacterium]|nr:molybdopterin-binding protein [Bacteroidota bacterium]
MKAVIISIGDELLIGQVVNTNASFIAQQLNWVGIQIHRVVAVGDDLSEILDTFHNEYASHDVIIVTGGLGPTHDDITRAAICKFFNTDLVHDAEARTNVERIMKTLNRPWTTSAEDQTLIPRGAKVIPNKLGTAPGEFFDQDGKYFFVMPGVPYEMEAMVKDFVVPYFEKKQSGTFIVHRTLRTTGIPES